MIGSPTTTAAITVATDSATAGEAAILLAAVPGVIHVLDWLSFSYNKATGGTETCSVMIAGSAAWQCGIANNAAEELTFKHIVFPHGLYGAANAIMRVVLSAGQAGCTGTLSIGYR